MKSISNFVFIKLRRNSKGELFFLIITLSLVLNDILETNLKTENER